MPKFPLFYAGIILEVKELPNNIIYYITNSKAAMNFNQYTIKAQEVVQRAVQIAQSNQQQAVETGHILKAILEEDPNTSQFLMKKQQVNAQLLNTRLQAITDGYPRVAGSATTEYLSNDLNAAFQKAQSYLKEFNDEFVSVELLYLGLAAGKDTTAKLMQEVGLKEKDLLAAIKELRGKNNPVKDQNAEAKYRSLERYSKNLNEMARAGKIDPVIGRDD